MSDHVSANDRMLAALQTRLQHVPATAVTGATPPLVAEGRKKFNAAVEDELLDYRHNHPSHIENCATTLIKVFGNVLANPDDEKYRQVKATSNTLKTNVCNIKGGEHLLLLAGWKPAVMELQKYWVFDGAPGSTKHGILTEAHSVLQRALATIHEKAEHKRQDDQRKTREDAARKAVLLHIADDKAERRIKAEIAPPLVGAVAASPLPAEARQRAGETPVVKSGARKGGGRAPRHGAPDTEKDEGEDEEEG